MLSELWLPLPIPGPFGTIRAISTFSLFLFLAFAAGALIGWRELKRRGLDPGTAQWAVALGVIGTLIGARLGFLFEIRESMDVSEALSRQGGLVFYWGLLAAAILIAVQLAIQKAPLLLHADVYFMALALGYGVGRLGCWISGDGCYGHAAAINIPLFTWVFGAETVMSTAGVRVWNTPIIEAILSWILFSWMYLRGRFRAYRPGFFAALFLVYDGLCRFAVEFLRLNDAVIPVRPHPSLDGTILPHHNQIVGSPGAEYFQSWCWYGFTESQIIGLFIATAGIVWIWKRELHRQDASL